MDMNPEDKEQALDVLKGLIKHLDGSVAAKLKAPAANEPTSDVPDDTDDEDVSSLESGVKSGGSDADALEDPKEEDDEEDPIWMSRLKK